MKNSIPARSITKETKEGIPGFLLFLFVSGAIILLLALGIVGAIQPYILLAVAGIIFMALLLYFRQDGLAATVMLAASLYIDWYLSERVVALIMILVLLCFFFLARSPQHPWAEPRALWLWALFLSLAMFPAIRGALTLHDALLYYPSIVFGAFISYWLGLVIGRNPNSIRRLFQMLVGFGVLIAIHLIIQATLHITLLESSLANSYLASVSNYELAPGTGISRLGSFFIQPNFAGTFFAMMSLIALGLFIQTTSIPAKMLYLIELLVILPALLFSYSASAWLATIVGIVIFALFVGRSRYRIQILGCIVAVAIVMQVGFSSQINLLLQHATDPSELALRNGVWQTALKVIRAYPLTGVGLGHLAYLQRAEPFRTVEQFVPLDHPHNSYLEWGAMAGLPILLIFLALIAFALWQTLRIWAKADADTRSLISAGIAATIALCINSWSNQGWTLPPLAALGWLILGAISSPLLSKNLDNEIAPELTNRLKDRRSD